MDHHRFSPASYSPRSGAFNSTIREILTAIKPLEEDQARRNNVINNFRAVVGSVESLRGATVEPFGSFVSNLYTKWGDLDISIELPNGSLVSSAGKRRKQNLLRDLYRALRRRGGCHNLQYIPNARVPLLIFQSNYPLISCDISISNLLGQIKSKILLWITEIDERFRDMVLLIKEWAKAQHINDPKTGTLNSYSLCLLVIFHFQTCTPPILPPLKDIYAGNIVDDLTGTRSVVERRIQETCAANIGRFRFLGFRQVNRQVNRSSLSELLISFFEKFSTINVLATDYTICTYTGQREYIMSQAKWMQKTYKLFIEDPFEQPENAARAVGTNQLIQISEAFQRTYHLLSSASSDRNSLIANLVRPHISSMLGGIGRPPWLANSVTTQNEHRIQHDRRLQNRPTSSTISVQRPAGVYSPVRRVEGWRPRN